MTDMARPKLNTSTRKSEAAAATDPYRLGPASAAPCRPWTCAPSAWCGPFFRGGLGGMRRTREGWRRSRVSSFGGGCVIRARGSPGLSRGANFGGGRDAARRAG